MSKVYLRTKATESGKHEVLMKFENEKILKAADETGAVIEKGISFFPSNYYTEEKLTIEVEDNHNDSMNYRKKPYIENDAAYFPFDTTEEIIEVYKLIKKIANRPEEYDIRKLETLGEKIKYIYDNAFGQRIYPDNKTISRLRKISFALWIICGILNTMEGKRLLYTLNYTCALLQLDFITLTQIIMSSSISEEKKSFILDNIKAHGINPEVIGNYPHVEFYTRLRDFEDLKKLSSVLK